MVRVLLPVLVALLLVPPGPAYAARSADPGEPTPLTVRLVRLSPATIPVRGALTLAGTVRNTSGETWSAINVHPFLSATPMTTRDEVAAAAASDPATEVGTRLTEVGQFAPIGDLEPGASARFVIRLPVADLPVAGGSPGVYWIGVHALGQNADGRGNIGRARTFIPLVRGTRTSAVSLVVPARERVRRDSVGRLLDTTAWSETLGTQGRLRRIIDLLGTAGPAPANLLVDPAVLEAVESVAADNPALSFGTAEPDDEPTETPSGGPSDGPSGNQTSRSIRRLDATDRANASSWLSAVTRFAAAHSVLGLGYADPDTSALARRKPTMLARADRIAAATFARLGIGVTPTVAPPDGWLDDDALRAIPKGSTVLVSDHAAPRTRTQWRTTEDQGLIFTDAQAAQGGPGPTAPLDALALRQRILADASLRAQDGATSTMVVELPPDWDPGAAWRSARFFEGLDQPWLDLVGLGGTVDAGTPVLNVPLGYPATERKAEVGPLNVAAARQLIITGTTLHQILRTENQVEHQVSGIALTAVSQHARSDATTASSQVLVTDAALRGELEAVQVTGTDFVTLSGGSGTVAVTLVNGLDQPITAGVAPASVDSGVRIETPDPLTLAPGERAVLRLRANASSIGVHEVTLTPVSAAGLPLGTPLTFSLRTSQVGNLVWIVLIAAGVLLVVMIGRRVLRGVREHRWRGQ